MQQFPSMASSSSSNAKLGLRRQVFTMVENLKPVTTDHTLTVKVLSFDIVLKKGKAASPGLHSTRIAECLIGDEIGNPRSITFWISVVDRYEPDEFEEQGYIDLMVECLERGCCKKNKYSSSIGGRKVSMSLVLISGCKNICSEVCPRRKLEIKEKYPEKKVADNYSLHKSVEDAYRSVWHITPIF